MGDDEGGAALGQLVKGPLDFGLGNAVQGGGSFVQDQDRRIFQEDAGNGDALLLPAGEERAPLPHVGVEPVGHSHDIVVDLRLPGGGDHLVGGGAGAAVANVLHNAGGEEEHILLHHANVPAQALLGDVPHIQAVDGDAALRHVVEAGDQVAEGGLAAAGGPHNGDGLAGPNVEGDVVEHLGVVPLVRKADVVHIDSTFDIPELHRVGLVL